MLLKLIVTSSLTLTLAGCYAYLPIKYGANQICGASSERKTEIAEKFDNATFPHSIRVHCDAQEN